MTIQFLGAAQTVTGSMHLLTLDNGRKILLDCGLYQGRREEAYRINSKLPFDPAELDAVILSHAHIDHSGNLPSLVKGDKRDRFVGDIYSTYATRDLCSILLPDSASIQEADSAFLKKHNRAAQEPLYTQDDVLRVLQMFITTSYNKPFRVTDGVTCTFYDAGHILGSALVVLDIQEKDREYRLCFTGDLGRPNRPVLRDPQFVGDVDILLSESTYGGRMHESFPNLRKELMEVIQETIRRGGKIIIPSFAVGRTQDIVYVMNGLFEDGMLPRIPIYVDSPLALSATDIFRTHLECFNQRVQKLLETDPDPFGFQTLRYIRSVDESKELNEKADPCVIISASGMMEGGRVLHHLIHGIEDERNTVLIVGYQASHTLGRRLVEGNDRVSILGKQYNVKAQIKTINGLSAHADHEELTGYIGQMNRERLQNIFLVHGESRAAQALKQGLNDMGFPRVTIPSPGDSYRFNGLPQAQD